MFKDCPKLSLFHLRLMNIIPKDFTTKTIPIISPCFKVRSSILLGHLIHRDPRRMLQRLKGFHLLQPHWPKVKPIDFYPRVIWENQLSYGLNRGDAGMMIGYYWDNYI